MVINQMITGNEDAERATGCCAGTTCARGTMWEAGGAPLPYSKGTARRHGLGVLPSIDLTPPAFLDGYTSNERSTNGNRSRSSEMKSARTDCIISSKNSSNA